MTRNECLLLRVETPICAFRPFASREYQDTYPVPTPASVYGMLLSLLGVERHDKSRHAGVRMSLAISPSRESADTVDEALPWRSSVFRKLRRVSVAETKKSLGEQLSARRPDYQDLLTDVVLWVWLKTADNRSDSSLPAAIEAALAEPSSVSRHGGLSLGESSYLVNRINVVSAEHLPSKVVALRPSDDGFYSLPLWTDHVHDRTALLRFELCLITPDPPNWFTVSPQDSQLPA